MKMIFDILEAIVFIAILSMIIKVFDGFIGDNRVISVIIVLIFLIVWIIAKFAFKRYKNNKKN